MIHKDSTMKTCEMLVSEQGPEVHGALWTRTLGPLEQEPPELGPLEQEPPEPGPLEQEPPEPGPLEQEPLNLLNQGP